MLLALALDKAEDEFICDLAEVYHVYDFRKLPLMMVASFLYGLKDSSRTKMKLSGSTLDLQTTLQAMMVDCLNFLVWAKTENAQKNKNRPKSILNLLLGQEEDQKVEGFRSGEEFEEMRKKLMKGA